MRKPFQAFKSDELVGVFTHQLPDFESSAETIG